MACAFRGWRAAHKPPPFAVRGALAIAAKIAYLAVHPDIVKQGLVLAPLGGRPETALHHAGS